MLLNIEGLPASSPSMAELAEWLNRGQQKTFQAFESGANLNDLLKFRSTSVDILLRHLWQRAGLENLPVDLIAVGGFGRQELYPASDIDLLILIASNDSFDTPTRTSSPEELQKAIENFVQNSWDLGLKVGHSVRTLKECQELAKDDITIATNLAECRLIVGSETRFNQLQQCVQDESLWTHSAFLEAKVTEQRIRHAKNNNTEYNLEPNVKTAPGGLRDIHTLIWICGKIYKGRSIQDLLTLGLIDESEYDTLHQSQSLVGRVRFALHMITQRDENRLLFDYQKGIALALGFSGDHPNETVERLMKSYYRAALNIAEINHVMLQQIQEELQPPSIMLAPVQINPRFQIRDGLIEATSPNVFNDTPSAILEIFVLAANNENILGVRASTIRLLSRNQHLINDEFRENPNNARYFIQLLRSPHRLFTQLKRMKRYGILGRYIPAFGEVIGQMQYDLFHVYTVDAHTLLVIQKMRLFRWPEALKDFPVVAQVARQLPKIEILYIAGIFHDIAKGRGGDHSQLGAHDVRDFCRRHQLTAWDSHLASWLVEHHLLMSITAQKKDLSDPEVIHTFAAKVGDEIHLNYLYAMTVADICATNSKLWNHWRASLLSQLYLQTRAALERGLANPIGLEERISETQDNALELLKFAHLNQVDIADLWSSFGDEYFQRSQPAEIAWHTQAILNHQSLDPLVMIGTPAGATHQENTQIFVYTADKPNLFAVTVAELDRMQLSVLDARIITSNSGFSLDTYVVASNDGRPLDRSPEHFNYLCIQLKQALANESEFPEILSKRMPRELKSFTVPTDVLISNDLKHHRTIIEVRALDRPGLLAQLGRIFYRFKLSVQHAKITTLGEQAEDIFFVTDTHGAPLSDPAVCEDIAQAVKDEFISAA